MNIHNDIMPIVAKKKRGSAVADEKRRVEVKESPAARHRMRSEAEWRQLYLAAKRLRAERWNWTIVSKRVAQRETLKRAALRYGWEVLK